MPRRNKPQIHVPYKHINNDVNKVRYSSEKAAQKAADERMLLHPDLTLSVYKGIDGGWYLTRSTYNK